MLISWQNASQHGRHWVCQPSKPVDGQLHWHSHKRSSLFLSLSLHFFPPSISISRLANGKMKTINLNVAPVEFSQLEASAAPFRPGTWSLRGSNWPTDWFLVDCNWLSSCWCSSKCLNLTGNQCVKQIDRGPSLQVTNETAIIYRIVR